MTNDNALRGSPRVPPKLAALLLTVAALGLPINDLFLYALLLVGAVVILVNSLSVRPRDWLIAAAIVALMIVGRSLLAAPRIEEGHNIFIVDGRGGALERELPPEVFRFMSAEFTKQYPPQRWCDPKLAYCWRAHDFPDRAYAFSADGIYDRPLYSRRVSDIDFSDATWHRLGFINDIRYNWVAAMSDVERGTRPRGAEIWRHPWRAILHPWHVEMPWFAVYQFPAAFIGSRLCWTGDVLWEGEGGTFAAMRHTAMECQIIAAPDIGRKIFALAIAKDAPLAMQLRPTFNIRMRQLVEPALALIGVAAVLGCLVFWRPRALMLPFALVGAALVIVTLNDASFVGGWRPHDGGDDGLYYEGVGRNIVQYLLAGDFFGALRGDEDVFYAQPGLRYLRALERFVFGDENFGYMSLMLALPALVHAVFRRFLPADWAMALIIIFVLIPVGAVFGTTYFQYVKWAARGYADPAAAALFFAGMLLLIGRSADDADQRFVPAVCSGFLFFLAVFLRPNLAPLAAVLLGGCGLAMLWQGTFVRLSGLCLGFLPVGCMLLHNWYFGGVWVLFGSSSTEPGNLPTPPSDYLAALSDLVHLNLRGDNIRHVVVQLGGWLAGPSESRLIVPVNAAAIAVLLRVLIRGRHYEGLLRLLAGATLAGHTVALFYRPFGRYYYVTWLLTLVVCAVWMRMEGFAMVRRRFPGLVDRLARQPITVALAKGLERCMTVTAIPMTARNR